MSRVRCDISLHLPVARLPWSVVRHFWLEVCVDSFVGDVFFIVEGADVGGDECFDAVSESSRGFDEGHASGGAKWSRLRVGSRRPASASVRPIRVPGAMSEPSSIRSGGCRSVSGTAAGRVR